MTRRGHRRLCQRQRSQRRQFQTAATERKTAEAAKTGNARPERQDRNA